MYTEGKYVEELFEINNYIIDHAVYDHEVADKDISKTMSSKAYGVLINGKGICTSYARAFQLVARMAGFICVVDGGYAAISRNNSTGEIKTGAHAWNMVCIQGNEWLMVDPTHNDYDDPDGYIRTRNNYLMIPKEASSRNRVSDGSCFAKAGLYTTIEQPTNDFSFDYMGYMGQAVAQVVAQAVISRITAVLRAAIQAAAAGSMTATAGGIRKVTAHIYKAPGLKLTVPGIYLTTAAMR